MVSYATSVHPLLIKTPLFSDKNFLQYIADIDEWRWSQIHSSYHASPLPKWKNEKWNAGKKAENSHVTISTIFLEKAWSVNVMINRVLRGHSSEELGYLCLPVMSILQTSNRTTLWIPEFWTKTSTWLSQIWRKSYAFNNSTNKFSQRKKNP